MAKNIAYGFDPTREAGPLYVDVPRRIWTGLEHDISFASCLRRLSDDPVKAISVAVQGRRESTTRMFIQDKQIGKGSSANKAMMLSSLVFTLALIEDAARKSKSRSPFLRPSLRVDGTPGKYMSIAPPVGFASEAGRVGSQLMQAVAKNLGYIGAEDAREFIGAEVDIDYGIFRFRAGRPGSSNAGLSLAREATSSNDKMLELQTPHAISPEQQLICLAGAIAVAHFDPSSCETA